MFDTGVWGLRVSEGNKLDTVENKRLSSIGRVTKSDRVRHKYKKRRGHVRETMKTPVDRPFLK